MTKESVLKITKAAGITAGDRVLIHFWGEDCDKSIANAFVSASAALGATPVLLQQARSINFDIFSSASEKSFDETYFEAFSRFDAVLDVFAYRPVILGYDLPDEKMALYRRYISKLFHALMKARRFVQIRIPTPANAEESGLNPDDYISRMEAAYDIDYEALKSRCIQAVEALSGHDRYMLRTGKDHILHFDLTGRQWHVDAGDGDMPCGEVYIAPVEKAACGSVFFEKLYIEDVGLTENVTLVIEDGRLIASDNRIVSEYISKLSPQDSTICELGLGMNINVTDLCGYTVLDEKMAHSFHIAIGANLMFGGQNDSKVHTDFVNAGPFELIPES